MANTLSLHDALPISPSYFSSIAHGQYRIKGAT
jgi:hypothetical protein